MNLAIRIVHRDAHAPECSGRRRFAHADRAGQSQHLHGLAKTKLRSSAFSGGSSEDDLKVARIGLQKLTEAMQ